MDRSIQIERMLPVDSQTHYSLDTTTLPSAQNTGRTLFDLKITADTIQSLLSRRSTIVWVLISHRFCERVCLGWDGEPPFDLIENENKREKEIKGEREREREQIASTRTLRAHIDIFV